MSLKIGDTTVEKVLVNKDGVVTELDKLIFGDVVVFEKNPKYFQGRVYFIRVSNMPDTNWDSGSIETTIENVIFGQSSGYFKSTPQASNTPLYLAYFKIDLDKFKYVDILQGNKDLRVSMHGYLATGSGEQMSTTPTDVTLVSTTTSPITNIDLEDYLNKNPTRPYIGIVCYQNTDVVIKLHN